MNNEEIVRKNIGRRFAEIRHKLGLTQDALAESVGVTGGYIRQIEGGRKDMRISTLCRVANMVGCSVKDLLLVPTTKKPHPGRPRTSKKARI